MKPSLIVLVVAFVPMLLEAARSRRNERRLRRAGAMEPEGDVYRVMQVAYPACFLAIAAEGWMRDGTMRPVFVAGVIVFAAAKLLKYWAISVLGERWTFRVLVLRDSPLVTGGPYRYLRHPNYLGVAGELLGATLMASAPVTGLFSILGFGALILARIRVEERALGICGR